MTISQRVVIIGNSGAAISAVKSIRETGKACSMTVISRERCLAYSPVLTTYYIGNHIERTRLFWVDELFYKSANVEALLGKEVVQVDPHKQCLHLNDATTIPFDRLLIASGSSAKRPRLEGTGRDSIFTLRTLEDAEKIKTASQRAKDIIFVGAGLVSLQVASQLYRKNVKMTFLVSSDRILSQNLDEEGARIVQHRIERMGPTFLFHRELKTVEKKKDRFVVTTNRDETIEGDLVFVGKGVTPNIQFLPDGPKTDKGVLVNDRLQTDIENIYAAGDVTEGINPLTNQRAVIANWLNACRQGNAAGLAMMGEEETFTDFIPRNVTNVFGLLISSMGALDGLQETQAEEMKISDPQREIYCKVISRGEKVIGANIIGDINDAGLVDSAIREGCPAVLDKELFSKYLLRLDGPLASLWERRS